MQFSNVKYIHIIVQWISKTFSSYKTKTLYSLNNSSFPSSPTLCYCHSIFHFYEFDYVSCLVQVELHRVSFCTQHSVLKVHPFYRPNDTPSHAYTTFGLCTQVQMGPWAASTSWLFAQHCCEHGYADISFSIQDIDPEVGMLDQLVVLFLICEKPPYCFLSRLHHFSIKVPVSAHSHQHLLFSASQLAILIGVRYFIVV